MIQSVSVDIDDISPELSALLETRDALAEALSELGGRIASLLGLRDVGPVPGATANILLQYKLGPVLLLVQSIKWNVPLLRSHRRSSALGDVDTVSALQWHAQRCLPIKQGHPARRIPVRGR